MNEIGKTLPEGYYNPRYHTYLHYTENDFMDCNPKSYKYILHIEQEIDRLNNIINELEKWLNKSIEYLLYGDTNKILRNTKEQFDEYGYFHDLGSINDIEGCLERVKKKLKELKGRR